MKKSQVYRFLVSVSVLIGIIGGFGGTKAIHADSISSRNLTTKSRTSTTEEIIHLSAQTCDILKEAMPTKANDPKLCLAVHKVTMTETTHSLTVSPRDNWWQCWQGTKTFSDDQYGLGWDYDLRLYTTWSWSGSCGVPPNMTYEDCFLNWGAPWYESSQKCNSYTTNIPSTAALYRSTLAEGIRGVNFVATVWQRRECYTGKMSGDSNDGTCNWNYYG